MTRAGGGGVSTIKWLKGQERFKGGKYQNSKKCSWLPIIPVKSKSIPGPKITPPPLPPPAKSHAEFLKLKIHQKGSNVTTQNSLSIIPTENIPIKKPPEWKIQSSPSLKIPVCDKRRL